SNVSVCFSSARGRDYGPQETRSVVEGTLHLPSRRVARCSAWEHPLSRLPLPRAGSIALDGGPVSATALKYCRPRIGDKRFVDPPPPRSVLAPAPPHYRRQAGIFSLS